MPSPVGREGGAGRAVGPPIPALAGEQELLPEGREERRPRRHGGLLAADPAGRAGGWRRAGEEGRAWCHPCRRMGISGRAEQGTLGGGRSPGELGGHLAEELLWLRALKEGLQEAAVGNRALPRRRADTRKVIQRRRALGLNSARACLTQRERLGETTNSKSLNTTGADLEITIRKAINSVRDHPFGVI